MDFNVRGFSQPLCKRAYLDESMLELAKNHKIRTVYGSDSHSEDDVGKYYAFFESNRD